MKELDNRKLLNRKTCLFVQLRLNGILDDQLVGIKTNSLVIISVMYVFRALVDPPKWIERA